MDPVEILGFDPMEEFHQYALSEGLEERVKKGVPLVEQMEAAAGTALQQKLMEVLAKQAGLLNRWARSHPDDPRAEQILQIQKKGEELYEKARMMQEDDDA